MSRSQSPGARQQVTPLPKLQLFILFFIQAAEPITALVIYPFVNQFVRETGITGGDVAKTGYYAGIIESLFFFAECVTVVQWGMLADRYGRRPVLLIGPLGLSIAMASFGLSTKYWGLIVSRAFQGTFNGNIGVSKSVIAEITDHTNIADAYSYISLMWSFGSTLAPIIGGVLSEPAKHWPDTFGRIAVFRDHPYFLPCLVSGSIAFATFVFAFFGLKESLPSIVAQENRTKHLNSGEEGSSLLHGDDDGSRYGATDDPSSNQQTNSVDVPQPMPSFSSIVTKQLVFVLANYALLVFTDMGNAVLIPLMFSTPVKNGGLGLSPFQIGTLLACFGFANAIIQTNFLGPCIRRFGAKRVFQVGIASLVVPFTIYPIERHIAQQAGYANTTVYALVILHLSAAIFDYAAYASFQILLVDAVPKGGPLATANGVGQMISSGIRTLAPTVASSLFSVSLQKRLAGGNLVFYLFIFVALAGTALSTFLVEGAVEKKRPESDTVTGVRTNEE